MAVDVHTHLLPIRLAQKVRSYFAAYMDASELRYTLDYGQLLDSHVASGIDTVWNLPYAHKAGMARGLNESMLEVASEYGGKYGVEVVSGCTVHPDDDDPVGDLRVAIENGAGVLKLHCSVGNYEPTNPALTPVLATAGELKVPVTIHAGHSITGHTEASELAPISKAAAAHPGTTFILAHSGHHSYNEAMELMRVHPNLVCDLTPVISEPVPITANDANEFSDRILFGTDAPNTGKTAAELLSHLKSTGLSDTAYEKITTLNAKRLIGRD